MTDIIGVLGEASTVAVGTHTVYTVPTGKAAKGKIMYRGELANTGSFAIKVNGIEIMTDTASGAEKVFSSPNALYENTGATAPTGVDGDTTVGPAPTEYYLSAGDTVQYVAGVVDLTSMNMQFVGTEIDVT